MIPGTSPPSAHTLEKATVSSMPRSIFQVGLKEKFRYKPQGKYRKC